MAHEVRYSTADQRYEIRVDDVLAGYAVAQIEGDVVVFPHTKVFDEFAGQGIAGELVGAALDDVRSAGRTVEDVCPYVTRFIDKHPEYHDLRTR